MAYFCIVQSIGYAQENPLPVSANTSGPISDLMIREGKLFFQGTNEIVAYDPHAAALGARGLVRGLSNGEHDAFYGMRFNDGVWVDKISGCYDVLIYDRLGDMVRFPFKECPRSFVAATGPDTSHHTAVGDRLFFAEFDRTTGNYRLRVTEGRRDDERTLATFRGVKQALAIGSTLVWHATPLSGPAGLFAVEAGTETVIRVGDERVWFEPPLVMFHGVAYLRATDDAHGDELWRTDGTTGGTALAVDLRPGPPGSWPNELVVFDDALYLRATGPLGSELYRTDGTPHGTVLVRDLDPRGHGSPRNITRADRQLYFRARAAQGDEVLWGSDGTTAGTEPVTIDGSPIVNPVSLAWLDGSLYFSIDDPLWGASFARLQNGAMTIISTRGASLSQSDAEWLRSWSGKLLRDAQDDVREADGIDWTSATFTPVSDSLFIRHETTRAVDFASQAERFLIYFDTDRQVASGYRESHPAFDIGAEYLLRGPALYRHTGDDLAPWELVESATWKFGSDGKQVVEMKLSQRARSTLQGSRVLLVGDNPIADDYATVDDD